MPTWAGHTGVREVGIEGRGSDVAKETIEIVVIFEIVFKGDMVEKMAVVQLRSD